MKKTTSEIMNKNMLHNIARNLESITSKYRIQIAAESLQFYQSDLITQPLNIITGYANNCPLICMIQPTNNIQIELDLFLNALVEPGYSGYLIVCYEKRRVNNTPVNRMPSRLEDTNEKYDVKIYNISALRYCLLPFNPMFPTNSEILGKLLAYKNSPRPIKAIVSIDITRLTLLKSQIPPFVQPRMRVFEDLSRMKIPFQHPQIGIEESIYRKSISEAIF